MSKLRDNILSAGIAVLLTVFFAYGAFVIYPGPDYEECYMESGYPIYRDPFYNNDTFNQTAYDEFQECTERQNEERESSQLMKATILSVLGALAIAGGALLSRRNDPVGNGIFAGGILTVIWGTLNNWGALNRYLRLFLIGVALALLIYIGLRKIDRKK